MGLGGWTRRRPAGPAETLPLQGDRGRTGGRQIAPGGPVPAARFQRRTGAQRPGTGRRDRPGWTGTEYSLFEGQRLAQTTYGSRNPTSLSATPTPDWPRGRSARP